MRPLVSCVMVTKPGRTEMALKAIGDWHDQTYPEKELIVVHAGDDDAHKLLTKRNAADVVVLRAERDRCAALRLNGLRQARGDFVTLWDDDDRHHPSRIQAQIDCISSEQSIGCGLGSVLYFMPTQAMLVPLDYRYGGVACGVAPGTLMWRTDKFKPTPEMLDGLPLRLNSMLYEGLVGKNCNHVSKLVEQPWLYVKTFHSRNATPYLKLMNEITARGLGPKTIGEPSFRDRLRTELGCFLGARQELSIADSQRRRVFNVTFGRGV